MPQGEPTMDTDLKQRLAGTLEEIREQGLEKHEWEIETPQGARVRVPAGEVLNFCANNYLGLANDSRLVTAAHEGLDRYGLGLSSVRFICGTQDQHKVLERRIAEFLGFEDAILYAACFDANGGLFEPLLSEEDAIISDALNHASIIDGVRLCKARRFRYQHADMQDLERCLREASSARTRMIATDGVFSMDGDVARLADICELAERHDAVVMVDDCHATGFFGPGGRGTPAYCGVEGRVDIVTSTLGKALGGASGGFVASRQETVALLRQRSRPYLFSNTLAPPLVAASIACLDLLAGSDEPRERLQANTVQFREKMSAAGFDIVSGVHPIVPIMLGDARLAGDMARGMLDEGIYVIGFSFPVVPKGQARIRVQLSAAHSPEDVNLAVEAFTKVGKRLKVI
jgi:glycine C-acetyltransferase